MAKSKRTTHRKNILMLATCNVSAPKSKIKMFMRIALSKPKLTEQARRNAELHVMNRLPHRQVAHLHSSAWQ